MSRLNVVFLLIFIGVLVWITMFSPDAVDRIQRGAMSLFEPVTKSGDGIKDFIAGEEEDAISVAEMKERLEFAERDRDRLRLEVLQMDELIYENNSLRQALLYKERAPQSLIAARVMSRKPSTWYNTLIIDKGENDNVKPDSPVIVPAGDDAALIGKVSEVRGDNTAVVLLLTDEMCQVSAKLMNTPEQGILSGQRGMLKNLPELKLRYLSKEADAQPGQLIVSSGSGGLFPPDLILGEVQRYDVGVIDAEAVIRPIVDFDSLKDVFVIRPDIVEEAEAPGTTDASEVQAVPKPENGQ